MKILFVCLGNICRSPMADGLLRRKVAEQGLDVEVDSAGTANYHVGEAPDSRMTETARRRGTDISFLRARQFNKRDFQNFDWIFVMDRSNLRHVLDQASNDQEKQKVKLLLEQHGTSDLTEVPDPYYGGQSGFDQVYDLLDEACDEIIKQLKHPL